MRTKTLNVTQSLRRHVVSAALTLAFLAPAAVAQQPSPSPIPAPSQPAPQSPNAPTEPVPSTSQPSGASPSSHMMRTWRRLTYACDGDSKVIVNVHGKMARVVFRSHTYNLKQVDGSDAHEYSDGAVAWMERDDTGSLQRVSKSGDGKALASGCHLQTAGTNPPNPNQAAKPPAQQ